MNIKYISHLQIYVVRNCESIYLSRFYHRESALVVRRSGNVESHFEKDREGKEGRKKEREEVLETHPPRIHTNLVDFGNGFSLQCD